MNCYQSKEIIDFINKYGGDRRVVVNNVRYILSMYSAFEGVVITCYPQMKSEKENISSAQFYEERDIKLLEGVLISQSKMVLEKCLKYNGVSYKPSDLENLFPAGFEWSRF